MHPLGGAFFSPRLDSYEHSNYQKLRVLYQLPKLKTAKNYNSNKGVTPNQGRTSKITKKRSCRKNMISVYKIQKKLEVHNLPQK